MQITFLGAAGTVTGSSYVLTSDAGKSVLIDLGMFQGTKDIEKLNYERYEFDCSDLVGAIITHAHLDHTGRLPIIMGKGFTGEIFMTPATRDLTELVLFDSAKIAKKDKKQFLYDKEMVEATLDRCRTVEYHKQFQVGDFLVTFVDAGHLLGSASLEIIDTSAVGDMRKIIFSGDLGNTPQDLQRPTEYLSDADAVVMESTYGDRLHPAGEAIDTICAEINAVEANGGTLMIPAFSLEKTQEILHMILHLKDEGKIKIDTPIFLDSPMAQKAVAIYLRHSEILNEHIQAHLRKENPFEFPGIEVMLSRQDSEAIKEVIGPKVILAGGGMMTGGRIVSHAAYFLPDEQNRLLIVGYQGEETLGRYLKEGKKRVMIDGATIEVRASVNSLETMSSHADQKQLLDWLGHIQGVKKVFLTHGEDGPRATLAQEIAKQLGISDVVLPRMNQEIGL